MGVKSNAQVVRRQVLNGHRHKTSGGLTKEDLVVKNGRIVSREASRVAKKNKNLGHHQDNPPAAPFQRGQNSRRMMRRGSAKTRRRMFSGRR